MFPKRNRRPNLVRAGGQFMFELPRHSRFFIIVALRRTCVVVLSTFVLVGLLAPNVSAATCPRTSLQRDEWIERSVGSLVRAARGFYINESAQSRYKRVVNQIAGTIEQCRLANN